MGSFAGILPGSNGSFDLQFHLGKTTSNRIKNLGFTYVIFGWLTVNHGERKDAVGFE